MTCNFPYTYSSETNSCITYADAIGKPYYDWRKVLIALTTALTFLNIVQLSRFVYYFGNKYKVQYYTLLLSLFMCVTMIIEAIDPEGFMDLVPLQIETLSSNLSTCFGIVIILQLLFSLNSIRQTMFDKINNLFYNGLFISAIVGTLIVTIVLTLLQIYIDYYTFRGIKFLSFCILSGIAAVYLNIVIKKSFQGNNSDISMKIISQRIMIHLLFFNTLIAFVVVYLLYAAISSFLSIGEERPVELGPDSYVFPICQLTAIVLALSFTSQIKQKIGNQKTIIENLKQNTMHELSKTIFAPYLRNNSVDGVHGSFSETDDSNPVSCLNIIIEKSNMDYYNQENKCKSDNNSNDSKDSVTSYGNDSNDGDGNDSTDYKSTNSDNSVDANGHDCKYVYSADYNSDEENHHEII